MIAFKLIQFFVVLALGMGISIGARAACLSVPPEATPAGFNPLMGVRLFLLKNAQVSPNVFHTLKNGKTVYLGGVDYNRDGTIARGISNRSFLYDPIQRKVCELGKMNTPRQELFQPLELNDGSIMVAGGYSANYRNTARAEILHLETGIWEQVGSLAAPVRDARLALLPSGNVLVVGGTASTARHYAPAISYSQVFSLSSKTFESPVDLPTRNSYTHFGLQRIPDGRVLLIGGYVGPEFAFGLLEIKRNVLSYDEISNRWSDLGELLTAPRYDYADGDIRNPVNSLEPISLSAISGNQFRVVGGFAFQIIGGTAYPFLGDEVITLP